jgi:parvulin-like peptidyl-prolyl isomerase
MVLDRLVKRKIIDMKLDKRKNIKHVMKHVSEELNIATLHTRAHDQQIKVSDTEVKNRYENDRALYGQTTLAQASAQIREQLQADKEKQYFDDYLENLRKNAAITRNDELLQVPEPNEADLRMHYEQNRASYPKVSFKNSRESINKTLQTINAERWFRENRHRTLVTIHGKRFTVGEFYDEIEELPLAEQRKYQDFDSRKALLDKMIDRIIVVEDTYDQMLSTETKDERGHIRDDILRQVLHQEEVDDQIKISEEEIKSFYENHSGAFSNPPRVKINYLRIYAGQTDAERKQAEVKVKEAYGKLKPGLFRKGEPFGKIAMEYSEDPETATTGGSLDGWISETTGIIEEFANHGFHENVLGLGEEDISRPFLFNSSYYIVQVRSRQEPSPMPFNEARERIEIELKARKHEEMTLKMEETLLSQADLIIFDKVIESILKGNE